MTVPSNSVPPRVPEAIRGTAPASSAHKGSRSKLRNRFRQLALFWFIVWPILTVILGALKVMESPTTKEVPTWIALPGVAVGVLYLVPEFVVSATLLWLVSALVFSISPATCTPRLARFLDPVLAFVGIALGVALEFPAVLNNPLFWPLRSLNLLTAYLLLATGLSVLALVRVNAQRLRHVPKALVPLCLLVSFGWTLTQLPVPRTSNQVNRNAIVILGIDSLGARMDTRVLRNFASENGGAWYENAITPGLLTNAVWTAILEHRPVRETGVPLTFQSPDWSTSSFQLIAEAKRRGFQTWSYFTGQNTTYVGSKAGFDFDRSGPMGWAHNATCAAKDGSILVPFVVSRLPQLPLSHVPANQEGTYSFDLRSVIREIVSAHRGSQPAFVVAHLVYLHDEAYPRFEELSSDLRTALLWARVGSIRDFAADWQLLSVDGDSIGLNAWKITNVQSVVAEELESSGFLDPHNGNRLVLLSDHGLRWRLSNEHFAKEAYYHVPLVTFGLPVRDLRKPISLLDISQLIGFDDPLQPTPSRTVVEYINFPDVDAFKVAILKARWTRDGRINIEPSLVNEYRGQLKSYDTTTGVIENAKGIVAPPAVTDPHGCLGPKQSCFQSKAGLNEPPLTITNEKSQSTQGKQ